MAYSMDFRLAVARMYDECGSSEDVAAELGCSDCWVRRLIQRRRECGGVIEPAKRPTHQSKQRCYDEQDEKAIRQLIKEKPDATLAEVAEAIGKPIHPGTVSRTLARMNLRRKKSRRTPPSRTDPTSKQRGMRGSSSSPTCE